MEERSPMSDLLFELPTPLAFRPAVAPTNTEPRPFNDGSSAECDESGGSSHLGSKPMQRIRRGRWGWPRLGVKPANDLPRANLTFIEEMVLDLP
jgi:hypothetical protein